MNEELAALVRDLRDAARDAPRVVHDVTKRGAVNIKAEWRSNARRSANRHARYYPATIGFDITPRGAAVVEAVIGPDKALPQGALGNLLEFGSVRNPPHNDGGRALRAEEPRFVDELGRALGDLL